MSQPKFTPGPWTVGHGYGIETAIKGWTYYPICYGKDEEQVCDIVYNKADADLIAAAPEMYEFIESLINEIEENGLMEHESSRHAILNDANRVIRKARGEIVEEAR